MLIHVKEFNHFLPPTYHIVDLCFALVYMYMFMLYVYDRISSYHIVIV